MPPFDPERFAAFAADHVFSKVVAAHGNAGADALRALLEAVRSVYEHVAYELLPNGLTVFVEVDEKSSACAIDDAVQLSDFSEAPLHNKGSLTLRVGSTPLFVWQTAVAPTAFERGVLVYHFDGSSIEQIVIAGEPTDVFNPTPFPTVFGAPTFLELEEALHHYATHQVRFSACYILSAHWRDANRLLFLPGPEATLRRSLEQHLRSMLRDHLTVRPEQVVDESHPVDLRVTWTFSNREALIEIKWLGKSAAVGSSGISKNYTAGRVNEGARQLANYLDAEVVRAPLMNIIGYLTVFDARRRAVDANSTSVSVADGLHYANREIAIEPAILQRPDFAEPVRMFIEPICD
jgi:hypothetical protein